MSGRAATPYRAAICAVLRREFGRLKGGAKLLAAEVTVSPRTAENWFADRCAPSGEQLIDLMASCDAIADEVLSLVEQRRLARGKGPCPGSKFPWPASGLITMPDRRRASVSASYGYPG